MTLESILELIRESYAKDAKLYFVTRVVKPGYGAQNEAYMSRSAEKWVRGLCFNELGVCD